MPTFDALRAGYAAQLRIMKILPAHAAEVDAIAKRLVGYRDRYEKVVAMTGVPWFFIAALHQRESDADFRTHLHNGDPLSARTYHVPAGRPVKGSPPFTWEESAIDALTFDGIAGVTDWTPERMCYAAESYNGWGYRNHGVPSAYVWSFSNIYEGGKYVEDGVWSSNALDMQCGVMPIVLRMQELTATEKKEAPLPLPIPAPQIAPAPLSVARPWWVLLAESLFGRQKVAAPVPGVPPVPPVPQPVTVTVTDFAGRILAAMRRKGYPVDEGVDVVNIVYVAGVDEDTGKPNANRINAFDDARIVLQVVKGVPKILGSWQATIETGIYYTEHPIAEDGEGAARITFDYHKEVWQVGNHRGYEALVQTGNVASVARDNNKDYKRDGDKVTTGWYGINQHHAFNAPRDNIGYHSAGCLVGRMVKGHEEFMALIKADKRYRANRAAKFSTTVLDTSDVT